MWPEEIITNVIKKHENIINALERRDTELVQKEMKYHLDKLVIEVDILTKQCPEYFELSERKEVFDLCKLKL